MNYGEATSAESRKDFVHKLKIVLKELKETRVALKILTLGKLYSNKDKLEYANKESNELIAIYITIVNTALTNIKTK